VPPDPAIELARAVNVLVEQTAQSMGYNSAATCAGYALDPNPVWAAEAQAFIAWRSAVWTVITGLDPENPPASVEAVLAMLPGFTRPGA